MHVVGTPTTASASAATTAPTTGIPTIVGCSRRGTAMELAHLGRSSTLWTVCGLKYRSRTSWSRKLVDHARDISRLRPFFLSVESRLQRHEGSMSSMVVRNRVSKRLNSLGHRLGIRMFHQPKRAPVIDLILQQLDCLLNNLPSLAQRITLSKWLSRIP